MAMTQTERNRRWRDKNREHVRAKTREYVRAHRDRAKKSPAQGGASQSGDE